MSVEALTVHLVDDPRIDDQVRKYLNQLTNRLCTLCEDNYDGWSAKDLSDALHDRSARFLGPITAAGMVLDGLLDKSEAANPAMWGTPLGKVLAYWGTGYPGSVTRPCAAAALGCTRQNVMLMIRDGRLSEPSNAGSDDLVSTASLAHAMQLKYRKV